MLQKQSSQRDRGDLLSILLLIAALLVVGLGWLTTLQTSIGAAADPSPDAGPDGVVGPVLGDGLLQLFELLSGFETQLSWITAPVKRGDGQLSRSGHRNRLTRTGKPGLRGAQGQGVRSRSSLWMNRDRTSHARKLGFVWRKVLSQGLVELGRHLKGHSVSGFFEA